MEVKAKSVSWTVKVPAGEYFLGDPCYAVPQDDWGALLDSCGLFEDSPIGEVRGVQVLAFGTAYGDGSYMDQDGVRYDVDSGLIGLVPAGLARQAGRIDLPQLGRLVTFPAEVLARNMPDGTLGFGKHRIRTGDDGD